MADQKDGNPPFSPKDGNWVSLKQAKEATDNYKRSQAFDQLKNKKSVFIGEKKILRLLSQEDAAGLRIYIGLDKNNDPQLFIVGTEASGEDILSSPKMIEVQGEGLILDDGTWCPPMCRPPNILG